MQRPHALTFDYHSHHCLKKMVAAAFTVDLDKPLVFQVE